MKIRVHFQGRFKQGTMMEVRECQKSEGEMGVKNKNKNKKINRKRGEERKR